MPWELNNGRNPLALTWNLKVVSFFFFRLSLLSIELLEQLVFRSGFRCLISVRIDGGFAEGCTAASLC